MKWAKCNLGANVPEAAGLYFSWGNTDGHPAGAGYDFSQESYNATPAKSISDNLTLAQDAARANLGEPWRMPTSNEFTELCNSAYTEYVDASGNVISGTDKRTTYNGVVGLLIRSKANGNVLFLPTAGNYEGTSLVNKGISGGYWSMSYYSMSNAYRLNFSPGGIFPQDHYGYRYFGFPVRAVQDGTPNRSIVPPIPENEETPTEEEPKDKDER